MRPGYNKNDGHFRELRANRNGVEQWYCIYCKRFSTGMESICEANREVKVVQYAKYVPLGEKTVTLPKNQQLVTVGGSYGDSL